MSTTALDDQLHYQRKHQLDFKPRREASQIKVYESATETQKSIEVLGYFSWCYISKSEKMFQRGKFENALVILRKEAAAKGGDGLIIRENKPEGSCLNITADLIRYREK